jgi:hypothetical protein
MINLKTADQKDLKKNIINSMNKKIDSLYEPIISKNKKANNN